VWGGAGLGGVNLNGVGLPTRPSLLRAQRTGKERLNGQVPII